MSPTLTDQKSFDQEDKKAEERSQSAVLARGEEDFSFSSPRHYNLSGHFLRCPAHVVGDESQDGNVRSRSCIHSSSDNGSSRIVSLTHVSRLSKPRELSLCVPAQPVEGVGRDWAKAEKGVQAVNSLQTTSITELAGGKLVMMPLQQSVSLPEDDSSQRMTTADSSTSRNQGNMNQHSSQGDTSQGHTSQGHTSQGCCSSISCSTEDRTLSHPSRLPAELGPSPVPDCGPSVPSTPDMVGRSGCITSPVPSAPSSYSSCPTAGCALVSSAGCRCACSPSVSHGPASAADCSQRLALSSTNLVPGPNVRAALDNTSRCSSVQNEVRIPDSKSSPAPSAVLAGSSGNQPPLSSSTSSSSAGNQCACPLTSLDKDTASSRNPSVSLELPSRTASSSSVDSVDSGVWSPSSPSSPPGTPIPTTSASPPPQPEPSTSTQVDVPPTLPLVPRQLPALRHADMQTMCDTDLDRLGRSVRALQDACFYYPELDSDGARELLQDAPLGTYLVRDSSDKRFLFAISLKTERGPTSVRIRYQKGLFQMDCVSHMKKVLPRFETMLELLDFHTAICRHPQGGQYRWLETSNRRDLYVRLSAPRRHSPPALGHLARVTINRSLQDLHLPARSTDLLPLPATMKQFLRDYPYRV